MKKIDLKSLAAGFVIGSLGITTVFGATAIKSAALTGTKVTLDGKSLPLGGPLVLVDMDDGYEAKLYVPAEELLEKLGYDVRYDTAGDTINLISENGGFPETAGGAASEKDIAGSNVVMDLENHVDQKNIAESGSFQAEDNQMLNLEISSDIRGGTVDLFLFGPNGEEQRIAIGAGSQVKEIALTKGIWQYNCSGIFKDGGNVKVIGVIR